MASTSAPGEGPSRRSDRIRKISDKMGVVDSQFQQQAILAHLDELEMDHVDPGEAVSDEEFEVEEEEETGGRKRRGDPVPGRKLLLQEAQLDQLPENMPSYLTAAAAAPRHSAPRKLCSVCGTMAPYRCTRCGARFCCQKCYAIHTDTRCLKFMA